MDRETPAWNSPIVHCWTAIILVACLVYAIGITHESIWFDEAFSAVMAEHSFGQIISLAAVDKHPPLYFLLLRVVSTVLGTSDWALRTLSVAGAVALVALGAGPVRRAFGNRTACIYAAVTIFTPGILIYAHEARMYTLAIFTVTASALYGYLAARHNQTMDWIRFGTASLAAAYLHNYALMAVFYLYVLVFLWLLTRRRAHLKPYFLTGGIVLAAYLPWAVVLLDQIKSAKQASWIPPVSPRLVAASFHTPFAYKYLFPAVTPIMSAVVLFSVGLIVSGLIVAKKRSCKKELIFGLFLLLTSMLAIQTPILVSRIFTPVFYYRYTIVYAGLLLLLLSVGISVLPRQAMQFAAVGVFVVLNVFTLKDVCTKRFNEPAKDIYQSLQGEIQPGDLIITTDAYTMGPMVYYFPDAEHYHYVNDIEAQWEQIFAPFADRLHNEGELDELLATHQSFWYVTSSAGLSKPSWVFLQDKEGWEESAPPRTYSEPFAIRGFAVERYTYSGADANKNRGVLHVHITGIRPVGYMLAILLDKGPVSPTTPPHHSEIITVDGEELSHSFDGLEYGHYVLVMVHDENRNHVLDVDGDGIPTEGMWILNYDNLDPEERERLTFESLKFSFDKPERSVTGEMAYPPFD